MLALLKFGPWIGLALLGALAWGLWQRADALAEQRDAALARAAEYAKAAEENAAAAEKLRGAGELAGQLGARIEQMRGLDNAKLDKVLAEVRRTKDARDRLPDSWRVALRGMLGEEPAGAAPVADPGTAKAGGLVPGGAATVRPAP